MWDRNSVVGGGRRDRWKQPFLYSFCSNILPRVGRRFGTIFKAIELPGSEQDLRPLQACPWPSSGFSGGTTGLWSKELPDNRRWGWTWNSSLTVQINKKEHKQIPRCCVCASGWNEPLLFNSTCAFAKDNVLHLTPIIPAWWGWVSQDWDFNSHFTEEETGSEKRSTFYPWTTWVWTAQIHLYVNFFNKYTVGFLLYPLVLHQWVQPTQFKGRL